MKVPVYEEPQAHPETRVPGSVQFERPTGYDAIAHGVDKAAAGLSSLYEKYQHEARTADVANGFAAYANGATDAFHGAPADPSTEVVGGSTPALQATPGAIDAATAAGERTVQLPGIANPVADTGFLGTRGKAAAAAEAPLFETLKQRRDKIAAGFDDPETKKLFLERVQQYDLELRAKAESHVGQQVEVEKQDAANNISDAAVRAAAADPGNDSNAAHLFGEAAGAVHGMFEGRPDAEALHDRALRADIASARLDNLLAPGPQQNVAKAREVLDANRKVLGKQLDNYERLLGKTSIGVQAESIATEIVRSSTRPDGSFNDRAALDKLDKVPAELADDVRPRLYQRMTEAEQAYKAESARVSQKAFSSFNAGGWAAMDAGLKQQLNQHNPELYDRLKNEALRRWKETKNTGAEARRQQAADNKAALQDYLARPLAERVQLDLQQQYFDSGADHLGLGAIAVQQRKDKSAIDKGAAVHSTEFVTDTMAGADGFLPSPGSTQRTKAAAKQARDEFKAKAERAFVDFVTDPKNTTNRPPSAQESAEMRSQLLKDLPPRTDAAAARAGADIARDINARTDGVGKPPKLDAKTRALQLKQNGKSNADIARILSAEGY